MVSSTVAVVPEPVTVLPMHHPHPHAQHYSHDPHLTTNRDSGSVKDSTVKDSRSGVTIPHEDNSMAQAASSRRRRRRRTLVAATGLGFVLVVLLGVAGMVVGWSFQSRRGTRHANGATTATTTTSSTGSHHGTANNHNVFDDRPHHQDPNGVGVVRSDAEYAERYRIFRRAVGQYDLTTTTTTTTSDATVTATSSHDSSVHTSGNHGFVDPHAPQPLALQWLVDRDTTIDHQSFTDAQLRPRYVLLVLYYACAGEEWDGFRSTTTHTTTRTPLVWQLPWVEQTGTPTCEWLDGHAAANAAVGRDVNSNDNDNNNKNSFIECDSSGDVIGIDLSNRRLSGQLPEELALLTTLTRLQLSSNYIKGTIPEVVLSSLTQLEHLDLGENELAGTISPTLGGLTKLQILDLSFNFYTGTLPASIRTLTQLTTLALNHNNALAGPLLLVEPPGRTAWPSLEVLTVESTNLAGLLPTVLPWPRLRHLDLFHTHFSGALPVEVSTALTHLRVMSVLQNGNGLGGPCPDLGKLTKLQTVTLGGYDVVGTLPSSIGLLTDLAELSIVDTSITGSIPSEIGNLHALQKLVISKSRLQGTIPSELGNLHRLRILSLIWNDFHGNFPTTICDRARSMHISRSCRNECDCCTTHECILYSS